MQTKGLFGARHLHKKVLELPIPKYNSTDEAHIQLATIGTQCHDRVAAWVAEGGTGVAQRIGAARGEVRRLLADELKEIDTIVRGMLGIGTMPADK
jgi:hypothetical protein